MVSVRLLNHACVILSWGEISLLIDPWLMGTCFEDGWGLRRDNPEAFAAAQGCTHLWISHFHGDHFHVPTLKKIAATNPDIRCLGNVSINFRMDEALTRLGFKNVAPFREREVVELGGGLTVERIPATGHDNMLVARRGGETVLEYNDCVLPRHARAALARKIGPVDVFLSNFNHAGKLLKNPLPSVETIRGLLLDNFRNTFGPFSPRWVVPFASHHYYRDPRTAPQNASLLSVEDLADVDARVVPLRIGEACSFDAASGVRRLGHDKVEDNPPGIGVPAPASSPDALVAAAIGYAARARKGFLIPGAWAGRLAAFAEDLDGALILDYAGASRFEPGKARAECDIAAGSGALFNWLSKPYGTDAFVVGGHFDILTKDISRLKRHIIIGMTLDNKIDPMSLLKSVFRPGGIGFFWNRREEIVGLAVDRQIGSDYQKTDAPGARAPAEDGPISLAARS